MDILLSPHNDDAVLFASFLIQELRPVVLVVFDSHRQAMRGGPVAVIRRGEDIAAFRELDTDYEFLGISDAHHTFAQVRDAIASAIQRFAKEEPVTVWAPAREPIGGNVDHDLVADVAKTLGVATVRYYLTYSTAGKSIINGTEVIPQRSEWVLRKLRALACYESQITDARLGCWPHFLRSQQEYIL